MKLRLWLSVALVAFTASILFAQPAVNFLNQRFSLDSNGALLVALNGYGGTQGPATNIANTRVKVDSNGALITALGGAAGTVNVNNIATTSTDGFTVQNTTAATAGVPVQMSPRSKWCGAAWNSSGAASETDCWIAEVLPATVAGTTTSTLKFGSSINGGALTYPFVITSGGQATLTGGRYVGGGYESSAAGSIFWTGRALMSSSADKLLQVTDNAAATGLEFNAGTPTLGTCTAGALVSGSHNFAGSYTGNTSSSCVINFGTPNFTNAPFCSAHSRASTTHPRISAVSNSSITVTGGVSGEQIDYFCWGRIGT